MWPRLSPSACCLLVSAAEAAAAATFLHDHNTHFSALRVMPTSHRSVLAAMKPS